MYTLVKHENTHKPEFKSLVQFSLYPLVSLMLSHFWSPQLVYMIYEHGFFFEDLVCQTSDPGYELFTCQDNLCYNQIY